jgi:DHA1 family multidrug resistance protein-like MFS transporter
MTQRTLRIGMSPGFVPVEVEGLMNRSLVKKCWTTFCIMLITISVYMGSSIVSPSIEELSMVFGVGSVTATLSLSLFVVGYGVGPLFLSPISEIPQIGRSIPYIITLALFCILQVPTALVDNFAGLVSLFLSTRA